MFPIRNIESSKVVTLIGPSVIISYTRPTDLSKCSQGFLPLVERKQALKLLIPNQAVPTFCIYVLF